MCDLKQLSRPTNTISVKIKNMFSSTNVVIKLSETIILYIMKDLIFCKAFLKCEICKQSSDSIKNRFSIVFSMKFVLIVFLIHMLEM